MEKSVMIVADFDKKSIRYRKNGLNRKVGDFALMDDGVKMMVYCVLEVDEDQDDVINSLFRRGFHQSGNFCDKLNGAVEEILDSISEKNMERYRRLLPVRPVNIETMDNVLLKAPIYNVKYVSKIK